MDFPEHFQRLHSQDHHAADEEEQDAEGVQTHGILRFFQRCGTHENGVERAEHHAQDQIDRCATVFGQCVLDQLDDADDAGDNAQSKYDQNGQHMEIQMQQIVNAADDRNIQAEDQQQGRAGNTGQNHSADGNSADDESVQIHSDAGMTQVLAAAYKGVCIGDRCHKRCTDQNEKAHFPALFQYLSFFIGNYRNRKDDKADEQGRDPVDLGLKDIRQNQNGRAEADRPADAQLYEILERINALRLCAGDQRIQRADELVIKAHQKCDRAAGNTRHAVRQRHTETMQYGNQFFHVFSFVLSCAVPVRATGTDRVYVQLILLYTFLTCLCNNKSFLYILYFIFIL